MGHKPDMLGKGNKRKKKVWEVIGGFACHNQPDVEISAICDITKSQFPKLVATAQTFIIIIFLKVTRKNGKKKMSI